MVTIEELLNIAIENKASDLHLTAGLSPKVRVSGELKNLNYPKLSPADVEMVINKLMDDRQRETFDQYGELDFSFSVPSMGRFRINIFKQRGVISCAIRIIGSVIPSPEELGMPQSVIDLYKKESGLILITGSAGSGKSTTAASIINRINQERNVHIITLEDPIEYIYTHDKSMINQREIGIDTTSYARALRSAMREDPDVIFIGEMKDTETISMAITAAEMGYLVISTMHTVGAEATIERIIGSFKAEQQPQIRTQLSMVLEAIVSQQFVPASDGGGRKVSFELVHGTEQIIKNMGVK